jgi:hypothetical protein
MGASHKRAGVLFAKQFQQKRAYTLTEMEGEMYFCNARCLCIWAVQLATRPNLTDGRKLPGVQLTRPTGEQRTFADVGELAKWSVANALDDAMTVSKIV